MALAQAAMPLQGKVALRRLEKTQEMDVATFLSDLYSELEQIEQEIRDLGLFDAGTDS
jgi:hypothetical protein